MNCLYLTWNYLTKTYFLKNYLVLKIDLSNNKTLFNNI